MAATLAKAAAANTVSADAVQAAMDANGKATLPTRYFTKRPLSAEEALKVYRRRHKSLREAKMRLSRRWDEAARPHLARAVGGEREIRQERSRGVEWAWVA